MAWCGWGPAAAGSGIAAAALACALVSLAPAFADEVRDPGCGEWRIPLQSGTVVYPLPRTFLRAGTDSVVVAGTPWVRGKDYLLDPLRGELRLLREPVPGETLQVSACWMLRTPPLRVQLVAYRAATDATPAGTAADSAARADSARAIVYPRPATARKPGDDPSGTSLTLSGNKTIAVDFGSQQDAFLRQSLDLAISGSLAPGVQLTGVLSDRNTPLTVAGSTQDLKSLDKVLLELRAPHGSAALGDVDLSWSRGAFGRIDRRLQGVRGDWNASGFEVSAAAATQVGDNRRMVFYGTEGLQGPYLLTDRNGLEGVAVVASSEIVVVDGVRLTRGESADYSMDYERGRLTFSNRRPISSESRITVEYQVASNPYRRNLSVAGASWQNQRFSTYARMLRESDDRGTPLDATLSAEDRLRLALAGDSLALAIGPGVTAGGGDYDTVRTQGVVAFAFAGIDSGQFAVQFAQVGAGRGDYADSVQVAGRTVYHYVGPGAGSFRVGRPLPLPESHQVWVAGGGGQLGPLTLETEGAVSRRDENTFSSYDDGDNQGFAGRALARLESPHPLGIGVTAGTTFEWRNVDPRFAAFAPLEAGFETEQWGLPLGANLTASRRMEWAGYLRPRSGGELRALAGWLRTDSGYDGWRSEARVVRDGLLSLNGLLEKAEGTQDGARFPDGGRRHARADVAVRAPWLVPAVHGEYDERDTPSDTGRAGVRFREAAADLGTGGAIPWQASAGLTVRRDGIRSADAFVDQSEARTARMRVASPAGQALSGEVLLQRRNFHEFTGDSRTLSDLASGRLRAERPGGLLGQLNVEVSSEGETRRDRKLIYVGPGQGSYDELGNFVGTGDYILITIANSAVDRIARAATNALVQVPFGGTSTVVHGSRLQLDFQTDTRRRGELLAGDLMIAPAAVLADSTLAQASLVQRLTLDLAPTSPAFAVLARIEQRTRADRAFENFAQTEQERVASARWRTHSSASVGTELELRLQRSEAAQQVTGRPAYLRVLEERAADFDLVFTPRPSLRGVAAVEASWSRPEGGTEFTRWIRVGPDLGFALGARGHADLTVRKFLVHGPPRLDLLPTPDPLGTLRWESTGRVDYRVHDSITFGLSYTARDREDRPKQVTGRCEVRAFF